MHSWFQETWTMETSIRSQNAWGQQKMIWRKKRIGTSLAARGLQLSQLIFWLRRTSHQCYQKSRLSEDGLRSTGWGGVSYSLCELHGSVLVFMELMSTGQSIQEKKKAWRLYLGEAASLLLSRLKNLPTPTGSTFSTCGCKCLSHSSATGWLNCILTPDAVSILTLVHVNHKAEEKRVLSKGVALLFPSSPRIWSRCKELLPTTYTAKNNLL